MNIKQAILLMRLHRPIGIFLLLWPTWWALWLASDGVPDIKILLIFTLGVILTRSAGCVFNDFLDRNVDKYVKRTQDRLITSGQVKPRDALILFSMLMLCAFLLVLFLNRLTIALAFLGAVWLMVYPFLKRITHLPQLGLGVAYAWGVPMAFAAENQALTIHVGWIFLAVIIWSVIYDSLYAMVDREDDLKIGIKSTAILFGRYDKFIIAVLQFVFVLMLIYIGYFFKLSFYYFSSILAVILLFVYQQFLIKNRDPQRCFQAFLNNNWVGLAIFTGIFFG